MSQTRPPVWQMVVDAAQALGGATTNTAIRDWILAKYPGTNPQTISCQIIATTVNHPTRIHYLASAKPRVANGPMDKLYRPARGLVELYDPQKHGSWALEADPSGRLKVAALDATAQATGATSPSQAASSPSTQPGLIDTAIASEQTCFAQESHLRDYLARNLHKIEHDLTLYLEDDDRDGVEFVTPLGRIDILAVDKDGGLVVIELKVGRGPDAVSGQIMRYVNWIRRHLARGRRVRGIIIAQFISDQIKYSIASDSDISAMEYELDIDLKKVQAV